MAAHPDVQFQVNWKPFFLNTDLPKEGVPLRQYLAEKYGSSHDVDSPAYPLNKAAAKVGIKFNTNRLLMDTMDSHRLVELAKERGKQGEMIEALMHALFVEGKNIAKEDVLLDIDEQAGMNKEEVASMLHSDRYKEQVMRDYLQAVRGYRVNGVPFFMVSKPCEKRKLAFSGAQPPEVFEDAFSSLLE